MKRIVCFILCCLMVLSLASAALAGSSAEGSYLNPNYGGTPKAFKFIRQPYGIGCGTCPVYTAPYADAYRCGNGTAACSTDNEMYFAGFDDNGWLLVRYAIKGGVRVGYIPPEYVRSFKHWARMDFVCQENTASTYLYVTDNPMQGFNYEYFGILDPGETYYVLAEYTYYGNWWYIECEIDGQPARGFIAK